MKDLGLFVLAMLICLVIVFVASAVYGIDIIDTAMLAFGL